MEHILIIIRQEKSFHIASIPLITISIYQQIADMRIIKDKRLVIQLHPISLSASMRYLESSISRSTQP